METSISIKNIAESLRERHLFMNDYLNITGSFTSWKKDALPTNVVKVEDQDCLKMIKRGTMVALVTKDENLVNNFTNALHYKRDSDMITVFETLSNKIATQEGKENSILENDVSSVFSISYENEMILTDMILDPQLGFNFIAIDFYGGNINLEKLTTTILSKEANETNYTAVIGVFPPQLSAIELAALVECPTHDNSVTVNFSPQASFFKNIVHTAAETAKETARATNVTAKTAVDTAELTEGVGQGVGGDGGEEALLRLRNVAKDAQNKVSKKEVSMLHSTDSEASVSELLNLRNKLLKS
ncbi:hypothetical protein [uncultured Kordia sp.]|uniref:hypothetical protein n=1 Tax=uncultured Kordia sp. TaxID=507699 RepID=UPI00260A7B5E|nr:hypothetical protein [uncultured Kordia sp.]